MSNGSAAKASSKPAGDGIFTRFKKFLVDSYNETFKKASWPTKTELRQFTLVVIFAVAIVSIYIGGIDFILSEITKQLGK